MIARTPRLALALAGALALAAAGCGEESGGGGGGGGAGTQPKPAGPSKQEIVEKADRICSDAQAKASAIKRPKGDDPQRVEAYIKKVAAVQEQAVDDIKALDPPPEGEGEFDKFVAANEELNESFDGLVSAVEKKDQKAFARVNRKIKQNSAKAQAAASAYGFRTCGRTETAAG